ncbi:MAG: type VI secretion system baseplate subunit TssF [Myxococcales bacterium FL481]|nr:MAG: type VI secretion system baseplate subunit TssF [Myxococcales bacterium FL481]
MFAKYYQSELTYLREMGKAFARVHPSTAQMLAERGGDPDVERLLEGFAFMSAQIRERVDDSVPTIVHHLTELLLPHYLRPVPACAIIEFTPSLRALRAPLDLPKDTPLSTKPVEGRACSFRTTSAVRLLPIQAERSELDETRKSRPVLRVHLSTTKAGYGVLAGEGWVRFHIHGELALTATLLLWLRRYCVAVRVRSGEHGPTTALSPDNVRIVGHDPQHTLFPWPERTPTTFRSLQEYFTLPDKFAFFEVTGLAPISIEHDLFAFEFEFDSPPPLPHRVSKDCVRLHCVPAINLFEANADPIRLDAPMHEYLLRPAEYDFAHGEVYSVDRVSGVQHGRQTQRAYEPFFAYRHGADGPKETYYSLRRQHSSVDDAVDTYISLVTPRDVAAPTEGETLSVALTCTNRRLANELKVGDISVPSRGSPTVAEFRNITAVRPPVQVRLGSELHWRLLAHLALNHRGMATADDLRDVLSLYNFQSEAHPQLAHANAQAIGAIRSVTARPATRLFEGAPVRGIATVVELEEAQFGSMGEAHLFGCMLDELFAGQVTLNSFVELTIRLHPSDRSYRWKPRTGTTLRA